MSATPATEGESVDDLIDKIAIWPDHEDELCDIFAKLLDRRTRTRGIERRFEEQVRRIEESSAPNERILCFVVETVGKDPYLLVQRAVLSMQEDQSHSSANNVLEGNSVKQVRFEERPPSQPRAMREGTRQGRKQSPVVQKPEHSSRKEEGNHSKGRTRAQHRGGKRAKRKIQGVLQLAANEEPKIPTEPRADRERKASLQEKKAHQGSKRVPRERRVSVFALTSRL
ncbi:hypothetical protein FA10DRAFT_175097 [Acaromyces ingoldii]|uniref:Uncharacterized protein n=1 Tax=Acaromyces ingoldii TaxID=215250 RepID=A0A316YF19_9BASI|nr:hypothetical protein FA10DRAFT_175097 [Acaromyces ingoldii]PWN87711.1 hypothetical protein FA10DRAFT_175097 [Acaromyces ingoldii]